VAGWLSTGKEFVKNVKPASSTLYGNFTRATLRAVTIRRPSGLTLWTAALLVLLPTLAVLQYRWVGQVSAAERDRMQRSLRTAAAQFRDDFDQEIVRTFIFLQVGPLTAREGSSDRYSETYDTWVNTSAHPQIVSSIFLIDAENGALRLRRWEVASHSFQAIAWPDVLSPWRPQLDQELANFKAGQLPDRRTAFRGEDSLLAAPLRTLELNPVAGSRPQTVTPVFGFTVVQLDLPFIRQTLLPELVNRHFSHPDGGMYRVEVLDADKPDQVIYASDPEAPIDPARADVTEPFFGFRSGPFRVPTPDGSSNDQRRGDSLRWRLVAQHESGSLEAAVAGVRRRNLAISFGVLLLLTISVALLAISSRRAKRLADQQMEFVAGISHELRTPVAVIRSAAENLSSGVVGNADRVKRYGTMIHGEALRLGEMVERVLQYAGIESGLGFGARTPLDPEEIINTAIDTAIPLLGPDRINIHREIAAALPAVVGDAAALRSAVQNLIANAVKYGGPDRWVGVRAEHTRDRRRQVVRITVSDHGPGIPPADLPHIFEPFYRGADALSRQVHGNGLGLSLVKRIVTAHGGQVSVTTRPGTGSAFTITLPAAQPDVRPTEVADGLGAPVHS
jgi:signal transduction histidine kinase